MSDKTERKLQIYKIRVNSLLEEHADVLAQAQELHEKLQNAEQKIKELEARLSEINVQEKTPRHTIIDMDASKKQG